MFHTFTKTLCYTEKAPNAWHCRGTRKTENTYNQPNRPSTDTPHRQRTKNYRKGSPGGIKHQLTQQLCTLQHNNNPPSAPTPDRVITRSFWSNGCHRLACMVSCERHLLEFHSGGTHSCSGHRTCRPHGCLAAHHPAASCARKALGVHTSIAAGSCGALDT